MSLEDQIFSLRSAIVSAKRSMPFEAQTFHEDYDNYSFHNSNKKEEVKI